MKTNQVTIRPGYGPRPAGPALRPLTRAQSRVLLVLEGADGPVSLVALAGVTGLHPNTVRGHLDALESAGLVTRHTFPPDGPGRPAVGFEVAAADRVTGGPEYAGLARTLAASIHRTSRHPEQDGVAAGSDWGHRLAAGRLRAARSGGARSGSAAARREVVALFDEIGFAPEPDARAAEVRLTRCPLLDAATEFPDVVCAVHLGIARGALEEYGADPARVELLPFSEPGACRLRLGGSAGQDGPR